MPRGKKREAAQEEVTQAADDNMSAEDVYAELAAQGKGTTETPEQAELAELRRINQQLRQQLEQQVPVPEPKRELDPDDKSLDKPVLAKKPKSKIPGEGANAIHTYRELGVHPDDLDAGVNVNPETGQIVRSKFIKPTSGNLIEMP